MVDVTAPTIENESPEEDSVTAAPEESIIFDVLDTGTTTDADTLEDGLGDNWVREDIAGADGVEVAFATAAPYEAGSLQIFINGEQQPVTEGSPDAGTFTLPGAPLATDAFEAVSRRQLRIAGVVLTTISVTINGELAFDAGVFQPGFSGELEPLEGGYRVTVAHDIPFIPFAEQEVSVTAEDYSGNVGARTWTFLTAANVVFSGPNEIEDDGGTALLLEGVATAETCTVVVVIDDVEYPCYSGRSGQGYEPIPNAAGRLHIVAPPLPLGGPFDLLLRRGAAEVPLPAVLTVRARNWKSRVHDLRRLLPTWYKMGPRNLDSVDLVE